MRRMAFLLRGIVLEKFPEAVATKSVGAFAFLRFICPAMVCPEKYHIMKRAYRINSSGHFRDAEPCAMLTKWCS